ncbi:COG3400 family protein [Nitratifractor sp.]
MKNILILAEGLIAENFIQKINQKRIADNHYTLVVPHSISLPEKLQVQLECLEMDPTSYSKMRRLFLQSDFSMVFIILNSLEDTGESLKNIRRIDDKIRVVLLDRWNGFSKLKQSSTYVVDSNEMIANHLYNFLPSVPVVAQNVGLGEGEIMEVLVPFGSTFAYRHVGSIPQVKWRIAAIYRDKKLILPNNATMIRPQDTLLLIGRPQVLSNIYQRVQNRSGMFPEPFGRNLLLLLDMDHDEKRALEYLRESIYLTEKLQERQLIVRVINPGSLELIEQIKSFESDRVDIQVSYQNEGIGTVITGDFQQYDIGLSFVSRKSFEDEELYQELYELRKLVYIFGETPLPKLRHSVILMGREEYMEAISSTSFYISETLGLDLCLCDFDPEGDFERRKRSVEHYETLSHIFHYPVKIEQKQVNPVRALKGMENVLKIVPFLHQLRRRWKLPYLSTDVEDYLLEEIPHPKLLIPVEMG